MQEYVLIIFFHVCSVFKRIIDRMAKWPAPCIDAHHLSPPQMNDGCNLQPAMNSDVGYSSSNNKRSNCFLKVVGASGMGPNEIGQSASGGAKRPAPQPTRSRAYAPRSSAAVTVNVSDTRVLEILEAEQQMHSAEKRLRYWQASTRGSTTTATSSLPYKSRQSYAEQTGQMVVQLKPKEQSIDYSRKSPGIVSKSPGIVSKPNTDNVSNSVSTINALDLVSTEQRFYNDKLRRALDLVSHIATDPDDFDEQKLLPERDANRQAEAIRAKYRQSLDYLKKVCTMSKILEKEKQKLNAKRSNLEKTLRRLRVIYSLAQLHHEEETMGCGRDEAWLDEVMSKKLDFDDVDLPSDLTSKIFAEINVDQKVGATAFRSVPESGVVSSLDPDWEPAIECLYTAGTPLDLSSYQPNQSYLQNTRTGGLVVNKQTLFSNNCYANEESYRGEQFQQNGTELARKHPLVDLFPTAGEYDDDVIFNSRIFKLSPATSPRLDDVIRIQSAHASCSKLEIEARLETRAPPPAHMTKVDLTPCSYLVCRSF